MLGTENIEKFDTPVKDLMIPSDRVAHVQKGNNLQHALLVLTKSGYTAIPVLDPHYKLHGLLSTPKIMETILGVERIEFEKLEEIKVEEAMNRDIPRLLEMESFEKGLELLIDHAFVCVVGPTGTLEGILTRRAVMKQLNRFIKKQKYS